MSATANTVIGRVGGLTVAFVGTGAIFAGRIGSWRTTYRVVGPTIVGRYGPYRLRFAIEANVIVGHVGSVPVRCSVLRSSVSSLVSCMGAKGGAEALMPLLAHFYAEA
jgi:outer membrane lipopolysaccharide assembly protein LptE/RlpB